MSRSSVAKRASAAFDCDSALGKPGDDLLSRVLRRSTIGAGAFHGRVRDGIGCSRSAKITRPAKGGVNLVFTQARIEMGADNESNQAYRAISTG